MKAVHDVIWHTHLKYERSVKVSPSAAPKILKYCFPKHDDQWIYSEFELPKSVATLKRSQIVKITDSILMHLTEKILFWQGRSLLSLGGVSQPIGAAMTPLASITPQMRFLSAS
jgi:hypothetical protein